MIERGKFFIILSLVLVSTITVQPSIAAYSPYPSPSCTHLVGNGTTLRIAIVPAAFDGDSPGDVVRFEALSEDIAHSFSSTEPYTSQPDRYSLFRVNDYSGKDVNVSGGYDVWYNQILIDAAGICDYNEILIVANNSGWSGGGAGFYSVVGSGTPSTCDGSTCTGQGCPWWAQACTFDSIVGATALHETGHTFAALGHSCAPLTSAAAEQEMQLEKVGPDTDFMALTTEQKRLQCYNPSLLSFTAAHPANCGTGFTGNPDTVCSEWDNQEYLDWVLPGDPNFGCYAGCDDNLDWYRGWETSMNIMCSDPELVNGYTPVDRKLLSDELQCLELDLSTNPTRVGHAYTTDFPNCLRDRWSLGSLVTIKAELQPGWVFSGWSGDIDSAENPLSITLTGDMHIVANYDEPLKIFVPLVIKN